MSDPIRVLGHGIIEGASFGTSSYTIYESAADLPPECLEEEAPYLILWLHGADSDQTDPKYLMAIQKHLGRCTIFMVPQNPTGGADGRHFYWGVGYTKKQNSNNLGFINGDFDNLEYLNKLAMKISEITQTRQPDRVMIFGYSMGGFGAYQIASHAPGLFDVVVSIAGYGMGTMASGAPQPQSSNIFHNFCSQHLARLADVPVVIAIHAEKDTVSSIADVRAIINFLREQGDGVVKLITVDELNIKWDQKARKARHSFHGYFNHTLITDSSKAQFYNVLKTDLCAARKRGAPSVCKPLCG